MVAGKTAKIYAYGAVTLALWVGSAQNKFSGYYVSS
jgi:hypothetical protein